MVLWCKIVAEIGPNCCCLQACKKHNITPGVFCLGEERATRLSAMGFVNIAYGTDTGSLMDFVNGMQKRLQAAAPAQ
jgi:hypothetical protein